MDDLWRALGASRAVQFQRHPQLLQHQVALLQVELEAAETGPKVNA